MDLIICMVVGVILFCTIFYIITKRIIRRDEEHSGTGIDTDGTPYDTGDFAGGEADSGMTSHAGSDGKIIWSDDWGKKPTPKPKPNDDSPILSGRVIYSNDEKHSGWKCEYCDAENLMEEDICCVCQMRRRGNGYVL